MNIETNKVGAFLGSIAGADYIYLKHCMRIRDMLQDLTSRFNVTGHEICQKLCVEAYSEHKYLHGDYPYTLADLARIQAFLEELELDELKKSKDNNCKGQ